MLDFVYEIVFLVKEKGVGCGLPAVLRTRIRIKAKTCRAVSYVPFDRPDPQDGFGVDVSLRLNSSA